MTYFNKKTPLTTEEQEIVDAIDWHLEAVKDAEMFLRGVLATWLIGFPMLLFSAEDSSWERIGVSLILMSLVLMICHFLLNLRADKRRREVSKIVNAHMKKRTEPFYNELREMFVDKPGIHLRLQDNGTITITDMRIKERSESHAE